MSKLLLTVLILVAFSGCASDMTGTQMTIKINECQDNNLTYRVFINGFTNRVNDIQCEPYMPSSAKPN